MQLVYMLDSLFVVDTKFFHETFVIVLFNILLYIQEDVLSKCLCLPVLKQFEFLA